MHFRCSPLSLAVGLLGLLLSGLVTGLVSGAATADGVKDARADAPAAADRLPVLPRATRGPVSITFTPDGSRALVAESDTGTLAVLDAASGSERRRFSTSGERPHGAAADTNGSVVAANTLSGSVVRLDLNTGKPLAQLSLRGEPQQVVLSRDRAQAFVSLAQLDEVVSLALPDLRVCGRITVGRRPGAMALTPDGRTLLVANFRSGDVSVLDVDDPKALRETRRIALPGVNLRGIAVAPDGRHAYVTGQVPADSRVTWVAADVWVNSLFRLDLTISNGDVSRGRLDLPRISAPDPDGIAVLSNDRVVLTTSGQDEALWVSAPEAENGYFTPAVEHRVTVGAHPRGLAQSPDGKRLWVANELGNSISLLDAATATPEQTIALNVPQRADPGLEGRYLFGSASMTLGSQFTCNSCHPGGAVDGLTWQFVHVPDGLPARNTRDLRGGVTHTAPFRWSGREPEIEGFLQNEITGLLLGPPQSPERLHAIRLALDELPMPPNPNRALSGELTPAGERGKLLFEGKAGCASCHAGPLHGGTGIRASVGTTPDDQTLDVPHLQGVFDTAPYLHDGRARTLEEIFTRCNPGRKHGKTELLTAEERADLFRYVREL